MSKSRMFMGGSTSIISAGGDVCIVNGKTYKGLSFQGSNVRITSDGVFINGQRITEEEDFQGNDIKVEIHGNVGSIESSASVFVEGDVHGNVSANGSVECSGNIGAGVKAGGSVECGPVSGDVKAGGSVEVDGNVGGDVKCGGSVEYRK